MRHCGSVCNVTVSICLWHSSHLLTYFSWESLPGHSNQTVESRIIWLRIVKFWIQPSSTHLQLHRAIRFVTYAIAHVESHLYLYIFCRILIRIAHIWNLGLSCCDFCVSPIWQRVLFFSFTIWKSVLPMTQLPIERRSWFQSLKSVSYMRVYTILIRLYLVSLN